MFMNVFCLLSAYHSTVIVKVKPFFWELYSVRLATRTTMVVVFFTTCVYK